MEEAIDQASLVASIITRPAGFLYGLAARYLPFLGFKRIRPTKTTALYLPGWIIDAEVEAKAKVWGASPELEDALQSDSPILAQLRNSQKTFVAWFQQSYVNGSFLRQSILTRFQIHARSTARSLSSSILAADLVRQVLCMTHSRRYR